MYNFSFLVGENGNLVKMGNKTWKQFPKYKDLFFLDVKWVSAEFLVIWILNILDTGGQRVEDLARVMQFGNDIIDIKELEA